MSCSEVVLLPESEGWMIEGATVDYLITYSVRSHLRAIHYEIYTLGECDIL